MAKAMALDYGKKRVGIALTDDLQIIGSGLTTVETPALMAFLEKLLSKEKVETLVIGEPKKLNNELNYIAQEIKVFIEKFKIKFPDIAIISMDERFTSKMATQSILMNGMKKKDRQNKALVDEVSATILLQTYLDSKAFL
ncbi:MAG: Holliday junction resolvase RuvX [Chitinophagales bacterium]|nr:Holliday junction resolvase RuvX [Chitinophagales bacterium]